MNIARHGTVALTAHPEELIPKTLVLQPWGCEADIGGTIFRTALAQAIAQADSIVVDLLWVEAIDDQGVTNLLAGMRQAHASGKSLAFLAMDTATRTALDKSWRQQRDTDSLQHKDRFTPEFEQFLDSHKAAKIAGAVALDLRNS